MSSPIIKSPVRASNLISNTPALSASTVEIECKKICVLRCLSAVAYSIAMQFLLLTLFLLFVNFSLLHPINWITSTFSLIFSIYTWLCIMPLISLIIIYGIYLGKIYLTERVAPKRRIIIIYKTILPKCLFVLLHVAIGFLTTWFYSRFLSSDMQGMLLNVNECSDGDDNWNIDVCFNERYFLFTLYGVAIATIYYFKRFPSEATCHFTLIHQSKYLKIRAYIYSILWSSLVIAFVPVSAMYAIYNFLGRYIVEWLLSVLFNVNFSLNNSVHIYDIKLLLHIWILSAHIWSNMNLMGYLFEVFLTDPKRFPIEGQIVADAAPSAFAQQTTPTARDVTLVEALSNTKVPIVRQLAAHDLYTLATSTKEHRRRQQIYTLSIPGGHPYNWNALSGQCFSAIDAYNDELKNAIDLMTLGKTKPKNNNHLLNGYPVAFRRSFLNAVASPGGHSITSSPKSATEMAEKIRLRQYNESAGMRNMMSPTRLSDGVAKQQPPVDPCAKFNECINRLEDRVTSFKRAILQTPGIHYLFAENETAQLHSLLSPTKTQEIAWIVQGITSIATHSLAEDHYGVVQINLPTLIRSLLRLKNTIDRVPNINGSIIALVDPQQQTSDAQRQQNGGIFIRNAVKRSLYDLCITFADYLTDLVTDEEDWKLIQSFVNFKEA